MFVEKKKGYDRLVFSVKNSLAGLYDAIETEDAFRHVFLLSIALSIISLSLHLSKMEHVVLICCSFLLLIIELLNTAIETVVDRISLDRHPLSKRAKDLGGAAQLVAVVMTLSVWIIVLI